MDIDSEEEENKGIVCEVKDNGFNLYPVSVNDSGKGLPYAPQDWPNPGDKWGWKTGRRIAASGHFIDRYVYLPITLRQPGQEKSFKSKLSLEQYVRANYPQLDINAFFASFSWKIPSNFFNKGLIFFQTYCSSSICFFYSFICFPLWNLHPVTICL